MGSKIRQSMTRVIKLLYNKSGQIDNDDVEIACGILKNGGVIAIPTDTVYGLASVVDNQDALDKIYKIKGRDLAKPLAVCLPRHEDIEDIAETQHLHPSLLSSLLPGPLTIILTRKASLNPNLNPGLDKVGIRVPDHNFVMAVSHNAGPLALTSANRSGARNPLFVEDFEEIWPDLDVVFNVGQISNRFTQNIQDEEQRREMLISTVIDLSKPKLYTIVRSGCALNRTESILRKFGYLNAAKKVNRH